MMKQLLMLVISVCCALCASAQLTVSVSVINASCHGVADGSANANVTGGSGNYTYQWDDDSLQATANASGLSAGEYHVHVTDTILNTDTIVSAHIFQPDSIIITATVKGAKCGAPTGRIGIAVTGGSQPYHYAWDNSSSTSPVFDRLVVGGYHVTVTDDHACTADATILVPEAECEVKGEIVFTPNGDGINDTWGINNIVFFPNSLITVFNRWGQKVFENDGPYEPWDGEHWGAKVPDATYYYVIYLDRDNKDAGTVTGSVTIVR